MLEAIDALGRGGANAVLVLVGTEELRRFVAEWPAEGFRSSIRVLPPTESIADLYSAADIFISASRSEGWPYSVAEALANGVPVASTRIPGVSWAADAPGVTFFRPGDSRGLVQAIRYIASLPAADRSALAGRSRAFIRERHSVQEWARRIVRLFEETTGQGLPAAGIALSARGQ
jgi:glycosyltransferase involved in cell wall biosynthesis